MFACKNCGGNVKFDIKSGQLACEYCHSLFDPYAYEDKTSDAEVQKDFDATISHALSAEENPEHRRYRSRLLQLLRCINCALQPHAKGAQAGLYHTICKEQG